MTTRVIRIQPLGPRPLGQRSPSPPPLADTSTRERLARYRTPRPHKLAVPVDGRPTLDDYLYRQGRPR